MHKVKGTCFQFFFTLLACHIFIRLYFFYVPIFILLYSYISLPYDPLSTDMCQCIGMASINIWLRIQEATCLIDFFHSIWQEWNFFIIWSTLPFKWYVGDWKKIYFIFHSFMKIGSDFLRKRHRMLLHALSYSICCDWKFKGECWRVDEFRVTCWDVMEFKNMLDFMRCVIWNCLSWVQVEGNIKKLA